jgi:hypothetical protein
MVLRVGASRGVLLGFHVERLVIHELSSRKFITTSLLYQKYRSKRVVIFIETKFTNYKCMQTGLSAVDVMLDACQRRSGGGALQVSCSGGFILQFTLLFVF